MPWAAVSGISIAWICVDSGVMGCDRFASFAKPPWLTCMMLNVWQSFSGESNILAAYFGDWRAV